VTFKNEIARLSGRSRTKPPLNAT